MAFIENIILGLIQGFTEFLPISSTGHLWIAEEMIFHRSPSLALEAFLHFATLFAVVFFFRKRIWSLCYNLFFLFSKTKGDNHEKTFALKLLLATFITGILGVLFKDSLENIISQTVVALTLIITGILVLISEYFSHKKQDQDFSWVLAVLLGIVQAIALFPGISRSGITIVFLLLVGVGKKKSLEISFLLSIPTILGAFVFMANDLQQENFEILPLLSGALAAFLSAFLSLWVLSKYVEKIWGYFSIWCFLVGVSLLFITF